MGRTPCWSRGKVRGGRNSREELFWSNHSPHSPSPCTAQGEETEESGVKLSLGKKRGLKEGVLIFVFVSHDTNPS